MKKTFDCVEMKERIQEQIYEETKDMSSAQRIEYFRAAAEKFWQELAEARANGETKASPRKSG